MTTGKDWTGRFQATGKFSVLQFRGNVRLLPAGGHFAMQIQLHWDRLKDAYSRKTSSWGQRESWEVKKGSSSSLILCLSCYAVFSCQFQVCSRPEVKNVWHFEMISAHFILFSWYVWKEKDSTRAYSHWVFFTRWYMKIVYFHYSSLLFKYFKGNVLFSFILWLKTWRKKIYLVYHFHVTVNHYENQGRNWRQNPMLLTSFPPMACSAYLFIQTRTTCLGMALPTVHWALTHHPLIKKLLHSIYKQNWPLNRCLTPLLPTNNFYSFSNS